MLPEAEESKEAKYHNKHLPLQVYGDSTGFNMNPVLRDNIINSQFFKDIYPIRQYHEVNDVKLTVQLMRALVG